jgi:hypothetical protein
LLPVVAGVVETIALHTVAVAVERADFFLAQLLLAGALHTQ